jgi:uncharacterized protein
MLPFSGPGGSTISNQCPKLGSNPWEAYREMMTGSKSTRRRFLGAAMTAAAVSALGTRIVGATESTGGVPTRPLGRTGERVSILCLGGWHIGAVEEAEAIRMMHASLDHGLTFFDNSWDYHGGGSEEVMGKALAAGGRREKCFLMTKNCERDYEGSLRNLEDSLRRLRTDYVDLWQFHEIIYDNDPDWVFEKGGIRAAMEAREQGKVRYIGFTGHKLPGIHLKMLRKPFDWDAAQMPINVMDAHYRSFQNEVVPVCLETGVGVVGMKSLGGSHPRGIIVENTDVSVEECVRYALSQPVSSLAVGLTSMAQLDGAIALAREFKPMEESEAAALLARTRPFAGDGRFERFKSTQAFDGGLHRRQHGFPTG